MMAKAKAPTLLDGVKQLPRAKHGKKYTDSLSAENLQQYMDLLTHLRNTPANERPSYRDVVTLIGKYFTPPATATLQRDLKEL